MVTQVSFAAEPTGYNRFVKHNPGNDVVRTTIKAGEAVLCVYHYRPSENFNLSYQARMKLPLTPYIHFLFSEKKWECDGHKVRAINSQGSMKDCKVCFSGNIQERSYWKRILEYHGGIPLSGTSKGANFVVCPTHGPDGKPYTSSKVNQAFKLGIPTITYESFDKLLDMPHAIVDDQI